MRRFMILVAVLMAITVRASAQDLYKCKAPDGRTIVSNLPCTQGSNETVIQGSGDARPSPPAQGSPTISKPSQSSASPAPENIEPQVPRKECLHIHDIASRIIKQNRVYAEVSWKVDISNRCKQSFRVWVKYGVYDKKDFELDSARANIVVPAGDIGEARGTMLVSIGKMQQAATRKAYIEW